MLTPCSRCFLPESRQDLQQEIVTLVSAGLAGLSRHAKGAALDAQLGEIEGFRLSLKLISLENVLKMH